MKVFLAVNKVLLVIAALCFIFIVVLGHDLSAHGRSHHTVLYDKHDCSGKVLVEEDEGSIIIRSGETTTTADFRPGPIAKLAIE